MASKIDYLFYSEHILKTNSLDELESRHCVGVLRHRVGDEISVTDGQGHIYTCKIIDTKPKACVLSILNSIYVEPESKPVFIAICPTKNADRIEYFLEKATEMGVSGFYFVRSKHTVAKNLNLGRCEKIVLSAMKQSLKAHKVLLSDFLSFDLFLSATKSFETKLIAHLDDQATDILKVNKAGKTLIMIGPEGDFAAEEIALANQAGFKTVKMGQNRLRTETAGVMAASILTLL